MKIKHRAHINCTKGNVEGALIGAAVVIFADCGVVLGHILTLGFSTLYILVMSLLVIGLCLTMRTLINHHALNFKGILRKLKIIRRDRVNGNRVRNSYRSL